MFSFTFEDNGKVIYRGTLPEKEAIIKLNRHFNSLTQKKVVTIDFLSIIKDFTIEKKLRIVMALNSRFPHSGFKLINNNISYYCKDSKSMKELTTFNLNSECKSCQDSKDLRIIKEVIKSINQS